MNKEDIITLEDNVEYMVLDTAELNHEKYLYCVSIDKEEMPTDEYKYFKEVNENGTLYTEEVENQDIIEAITALFAASILESVTDEEQDV